MSNYKKEIAVSAALAIVLVVSLSLASNFLYFISTGPPELETEVPEHLNKFSSHQELLSFLGQSYQSPYYLFDLEVRGIPPGPITALESDAAKAGDYSTTNIQVEGVDEADIVKTDGEHIYVVSGNTVFILKAYPPQEAVLLSQIELEGGVTGVFINEGRLVVFEGGSPYWGGVLEKEGGWSAPNTSILVYDVSDGENPALKRNITLDGNYFNSRMIGDYVYVVIQQWVAYQEEDVDLPSIAYRGEIRTIRATDIYYSNVTDSSYAFTTIAAVNVKDDTEAPTYETFMIGASSTMYVSLSNIYITVPRWQWEPEPLLGQLSEPLQTTDIYRFSIDRGTIESKASGVVPGIVLNQFSMDEHQDHFRIATTTSHVARTPEEASSSNHVYVLDMDLNVVGSLEDLAPGETIYSARFMGDRGYLVTFKKVDPLFVIDLAEPTVPKVLGWLKITGYSDYLHPYDENYVIGIGKEAVPAEDGDFAWYQGVKISLFDVSDVANPVEIAKYVIGDRGTESPVLQDHKALLFDRA
ncbi:MAG: beta-propeller domain-containing protein, partial [Candidatus Geothermarchaeales archaeon]